MAESMTEPTDPPPAIRGRHPPPETIHPLSGKLETLINASVICPQQIIRFPYAAPFECRVNSATRHLGLPPATCIDVSVALFDRFHYLLGDRGHAAVSGVISHAGVLIGAFGTGVVTLVLG
jgi:hypothetical protein